MNCLKKGDTVKILGFNDGNRHYRAKLLALGLLPGTLFTVSHIAPFGDPVEIEIRGYTLSLRRHEAAILIIETL